MDKENFDLFLEYMVKEPNDSLMELEKRERDSGFPIIKRGAQGLLRLLISTINPQNILELGCGVGFSAILMAEYGDNSLRIDTIELKEDNIKRARANISDFGYEDRINIISGDAVKIIKEGNLIRDTYDLIFVDFAKAQYANLWEDLRGLVRVGGIIITDDILQNETVINSRFLLNRRDRTIHKRMRKYIYEQLNDPDFTGSVFEIDDGVSILTRNKE